MFALEGLERKAKRDRARSALGTGRQHACSPCRVPYFRVFHNDNSEMQTHLYRRQIPNWCQCNELKPDAKGNVLMLTAEGKKNKRGREEERDVSERIALGQVE